MPNNHAGLLWFNRGGSQTAVIRQAAARFTARMGVAPAVCFVNPGQFIESAEVDGILVQPKNGILKHHYLLTGGESNG
ncbi:MAG: hypothetical protein C4589_00265 [Peptococcaceae bacterium]|jgi:hypothetical protein|nr:MAG: hypothetical protein C4589_00265 [Peptococcaceae bacterium]